MTTRTLARRALAALRTALQDASLADPDVVLVLATRRATVAIAPRAEVARAAAVAARDPEGTGR